MRLRWLLAALAAVALGAGPGPGVRVYPAGFHTLALGSDGRLWGWGANGSGQLGDGTLVDHVLPTPGVLPSGVAAQALAGGEAHSLLLTVDGRIFACGLNDRGQLGGPGWAQSKVWVEVRGIPRAVALACGPHHSFILTAEGQVWGWGDNAQGQVLPGGASPVWWPQQVPVSGVKALAAGPRHTLALRVSGELWGWGDGREGALGSLGKGERLAPGPLKGLPPLRQVGAGEGFSVGLAPDGRVWAWGRNHHGQLGDGTTRSRAEAQPVVGLTGIIDVGVGRTHTVAQTAQGDLFAWGDNNLSQLGHSAPSYTPHPVPVAVPEEPRRREPWRLAVGPFHTFVSHPGGTLWGFGYNEFSQLGDWSYQNRRVPVNPRKAIP